MTSKDSLWSAKNESTNSVRMTATVVLVAAGFMNRIEPVLSKCPAIPSRLEARASLSAATSSHVVCDHGEPILRQ
jgi:hypothetical protein